MSDKVRETSGSDQVAAAESPSSRLARPCEGTPPGWNSTKNCRRRIPVSPKRGVVMPVVAGAELNICDVAGAKLNICDVVGAKLNICDVAGAELNNLDGPYKETARSSL